MTTYADALELYRPLWARHLYDPVLEPAKKMTRYLFGYVVLCNAAGPLAAIRDGRARQPKRWAPPAMVRLEDLT